MRNTAILESCYFPNIAWMASFINASNVWIEHCDFYEKQSLRNRCHILGAEKEITLSVPLVGGRNQKILMKDVKINYAENWQTQHGRALQSCYGKSPFFEFYGFEIINLINAKHIFLVDLNYSILGCLAKWLHGKAKIQPTDTYLPAPEIAISTIDLRHISRKKIDNPAYQQVFSERQVFYKNLSILDALFCLGPEINLYLKNCTEQFNLNVPILEMGN